MSSLRPLGWRGLVSAAILSAATIGVAACGGSGDDNAGAADRQVNSQQSTQSNTQSSSSNQSNSSTQSGGGSTSQSSFSTDEGTVRLYAGSSDTTITVDVDGDSRLLWSNDKGKQFRLSGAGSSIDSSDGSGEVPLSGGRHRLEVHGQVWTIVIRPG
jgi:hypothetical protein